MFLRYYYRLPEVLAIQATESVVERKRYPDAVRDNVKDKKELKESLIHDNRFEDRDPSDILEYCASISVTTTYILLGYLQEQTPGIMNTIERYAEENEKNNEASRFF